ncbi:MAG TPA: hypothetical protein PKA13_00815 [Geminicoccaceae bacterium]|nr:hypothetical protein [Geminicoccus sp.]HMU48280.1 hypothetical protein [Geminicoccaceae bacterium]
MLFWLLLGGAGLVLAMVAARWFTSVAPGDLVRAARTFVAVFGALAGSGLLMMGRVGLAVVLLAAAFTAGKTLWAGRRAPDPMEPGGHAPAGSSAVSTALLAMRLDHRTGALDGEVRGGTFAGRALATLGIAELLALLREAARDDPPSVSLLETYLDRRFPDWRERAAGLGRDGGAATMGAAAMDEATALEILGLGRGADEQAIRAAHRRLMSRLHPDHGGSDWLAARINQARDFLLGGRA